MKERTNHMEYMEGMEVIDSTLLDEVISAMDAYDYDKYTDKDVENALSHDVLTTEDFAALLSSSRVESITTIPAIYSLRFVRSFIFVTFQI